MVGPAVGAVVMACRLARRIRRVEVHGRSMLPGLRPGERVVVIPLRRARTGHIVAFPDPRHPGRVLVKRVRAVGPSGLEVVGDNQAESTDSRTFGPVNPRSVLGRAVYRYAPAGRAGRLRR